MSERSKLRLKADKPQRDPFRQPVRGHRPRTAELAPLAPLTPLTPREPPAAPPTAPPTAAPRPTTPRSAPPRPPQARAAAPRPAPQPAPPTPPPAPAGVRLSKVMADRAIASRREADEWIEAGWVRVDGRMAVLGQRIAGTERIEVDAAARKEQTRRVTVLLHKPVGLVSGQAEDGYEPAITLVTPANRWADDRGIAWHPGHLRSLAPAGRLDIDSTGLLVLTQDGRIARQLIGEDADTEKEYLVRVQPFAPDSFPPHGLDRLRHGLWLDDRPLKPAKVSWANEDQLRIVLREGRKRQIRRMCELVGLRVLGLKRVRIGSVTLGRLPPGQWRYLRDDERF